MKSEIAAAEQNGTEPGYTDTIALLQEEIARLQEEVAQRDEALAETEMATAHVIPVSDAESIARISDLTSELGRRDDTITFLLEEIRLVGEAETTGKSEWEQLNQWVEQLEKRVDSRTEQDTKLSEELDSERLKAEALRTAVDAERRAWDKRHTSLEEEVKRLRAKPKPAANSTEDETESALDFLENENCTLREERDRLKNAAPSAAEIEALQGQLAAKDSLLKETRTNLLISQDDRQSEHNQHHAALAALRSQFACEQLRDCEQRTSAAASGTSVGQASSDERIRAFRQHLHEVHQSELQERQEKRLSARLSRMWKKTVT
jgi:hypothetical protein